MNECREQPEQKEYQQNGNSFHFESFPISDIRVNSRQHPLRMSRLYCQFMYGASVPERGEVHHPGDHPLVIKNQIVNSTIVTINR